MTAPSSLVSAESHLLVPPQTQSFSYCHLPDVKATINCNKSSIMEVVSFLKYVYDPNVHISSCLQDCKLCWDANWCPVSVNLSGTGGQQVEWRFTNIEEIFLIGLLNQTTSPLQQSLNKLLSHSSVNQTLKYLNLASNDLHGNVAVLQRLSNLIELDLRNNSLSGDITFLATWKQLNRAKLNVSLNGNLTVNPMLFSNKFHAFSFLETKSDAVTTTTAVPQIAPIPAPKHDAASTPAHRHVPPPVAHQFVPTPPPAPWKHAPRPAPPPRPAPTSPAPTPAPTPAPPTPPPALNKTPKHPPPPPTRVAPTPSRTPATTPAATPAPTFHDFNLGGPTLGKLDPQHVHQSRYTRVVLGLILGILGVGLVLTSIFIQLRKQRDPDHVLTRCPSVGPNLLGSVKSMTLSFDDVSQATCDFDKDHILGNSGIMGPLYRGTLIDGMMVVVRKLPRGMLTKDEDLGTLYSIQYRHCLLLRSHFISKGSTFLVYDYMANGSLEQTLHGMKASQTALAWSVRLQIALGIAQALNYLHHECSPCIVHQNVTSRNVLIDDNMDAKLTDIGLLQFARTCRSKVVVASLVRSGYAAPEFAQPGSMSEKIDVYSFGVMLLELLTGRKPADFLQKPEANTLPDWTRERIENSQAVSLIDSHVKATCESSDRLHQVLWTALQCTVATPLHRPTMKEVVKALQAVAPVT